MGWRGGFGGNSHGTGAVIEEDTGPKSRSDWTLIRRLLTYFSERRRAFAYMVVSVVIFTATGVVGPILTAYAIDQYIFPNGKVGNDAAGLLFIVLAYTVITVVMYVSSTSRPTSWPRRPAVIYRLRKDAVDKLERLSLH